MSVYEPEATPSLAATKIAVTTGVADKTAPKLATEIKAASSVEGTLVFRDFAPTVDENSGNAPKRMGTRNQFPQPGNANYQRIQVNYPRNPQGDDSDANNKMGAALAEGAIRDIVLREGPDAVDVDFAVDDLTTTWTVRCGRRTRTRSGDDEFAEFEYMQYLYPTSEEVDGVIEA